MKVSDTNSCKHQLPLTNTRDVLLKSLVHTGDRKPHATKSHGATWYSKRLCGQSSRATTACVKAAPCDFVATMCGVRATKLHAALPQAHVWTRLYAIALYTKVDAQCDKLTTVVGQTK